MASSRDASTLAALHPSRTEMLSYSGHRPSVRPQGSHFMSLKRPSRLPESAREYVPGDPPVLIDWKAFGRTDQLVIRERRDEATATIMIGLDVSDTMLWPDATVEAVGGNLVTKAEVAWRVALYLAHLHARQGDAIELWLTDTANTDTPSRLLRPRGMGDVVGLFDTLSAAGFAPSAWADLGAAVVLERRRRDAVFWVGDGLGAADYAAFLACGRRSLCVQVLSSLELEINWTEAETSYFDPGLQARPAASVATQTSGGVGRREYQGHVLRHRSGYATQLLAWRRDVEECLRAQGSDYLCVSEATPISDLHDATVALARRAVTP